MAVSEIFGGALLFHCIFHFRTGWTSGAQRTDIYLTGIAMLLTIVYSWGLLLLA